MRIPNRSLIVRPDGSVWWTTNLPDTVDGIELTSPPIIKRMLPDGTTETTTAWEEGCFVLDCTAVEPENFEELLQDSGQLRVRENTEGKIEFFLAVDTGEGETVEIKHPAETKQEIRDEVKVQRVRNSMRAMFGDGPIEQSSFEWPSIVDDTKKK